MGWLSRLFGTVEKKKLRTLKKRYTRLNEEEKRKEKYVENCIQK